MSQIHKNGRSTPRLETQLSSSNVPGSQSRHLALKNQTYDRREIKIAAFFPFPCPAPSVYTSVNTAITGPSLEKTNPAATPSVAGELNHLQANNSKELVEGLAGWRDDCCVRLEFLDFSK